MSALSRSNREIVNEILKRVDRRVSSMAGSAFLPTFVRVAVFTVLPTFVRVAVFTVLPTFVRVAVFTGRPTFVRVVAFTGRPTFVTVAVAVFTGTDACRPDTYFVRTCWTRPDQKTQRCAQQ
jgi:hypothetical protein